MKPSPAPPALPVRPLIIQSDRTILLEVNSPVYPEVRDELARFCELEKSPEHIHTYRLTPLSIWNAASCGMTAPEMVGVLEKYSKYDIPQNIRRELDDTVARFGKVKLLKSGEEMVLVSKDPLILDQAFANAHIKQFLRTRRDPLTVTVDERHRGLLKQSFIRLGFPIEDLAGYLEGAPLTIKLRRKTLSGTSFDLRPYQQEAREIFYARGTVRGGSGVIVLPCGAGKTVVGLGILALLHTHTLVLTTSLTAVRQWQREILDKTELTADQVGEYSGVLKDIRPVTVTTYQILTYRKSRTDPFKHFEIFSRYPWGLIVYDEVHLLPAPVFRVTADIQARRRLGLTATLVREDHKEDEVFTLIGPKKYDVPWKVLEKQGYIAPARCTEVRVPLPPERKAEYALAASRTQFRLASENPAKLEVLEKLVQRHADDLVLIIGQYLDQLKLLAARLEAPLITGKTPNKDRERLYQDFREGTLRCLVVSKVGNFAIDLPDANVAIQVSGTFGSRQEEAQRLGRILRPKPNEGQAHFYSLVTRDTRDQDFATRRQLFLTEQGYAYEIRDAAELLGGIPG